MARVGQQVGDDEQSLFVLEGRAAARREVGLVGRPVLRRRLAVVVAGEREPQPLGRVGGALDAELEQAKLLKVDRAARVGVDGVDHLAHLSVRWPVAQLAEHHAELVDVDVAAAVAVEGGEGVVELGELLLREHRVGGRARSRGGGRHSCGRNF